MTNLLYLIGTSVERVIAGIFMQANQAFVKGINSSSSISVIAANADVSFFLHLNHNLIILTATLLSIYRTCR
jgi:hypothetical protein